MLEKACRKHLENLTRYHYNLHHTSLLPRTPCVDMHGFTLVYMYIYRNIYILAACVSAIGTAEALAKDVNSAQKCGSITRSDKVKERSPGVMHKFSWYDKGVDKLRKSTWSAPEGCLHLQLGYILLFYFH